MKNIDPKLTKEEREIEESISRGEYVSAPGLKETKKMFNEAVSEFNELKKSKKITIRINQEDLIKVKAKAQRNKIPYQTLLNALIHQFAAGKTRVEF